MHRGTVPIALLVSLLLAGCADDDEPAHEPTLDDTDGGSDQDDRRQPWQVDGPTAAEVEPGAPTRFTIDLVDLDYRDELVRYALVAQAPLPMTYNHSANVPTVYGTDTCAAGAITATSGGSIVANSFAVAWAAPTRTDAEVRAMGTGTGTGDLSGDTSGGDQGLTGSGSFAMEAGDQLIVELGGHDPAFLNASMNLGQRPVHWRYEFEASGPVEIVELPRQAVRCGVGSYQMDGTLHAHGYLVDAAADVAASLSSTSGSSLYYNQGLANPAKQATVEFHNQTVEQAEWAIFTSPLGGEMEIRFNAWADAGGSSHWFMADAYWPALESAS